MPLIGCLLLIIFPLLGLIAGGMVWGDIGVKWGAGIGFGIALLACALGLFVLIKGTRRR